MKHFPSFLSKPKTIPFLIIFIALASCNTEEVQPIVDEPIAEVPAFENNLEQMTQVEHDFILKLLKVDAEMNSTWSTFNLLRERPIFIVTGINQGVFINPPVSELVNSRKITDSIAGFENLELYRHNALVSFTKENTSDVFFYSWNTYQGFDIFLYDISGPIGNNFYFQYKNRNGHYFAGVFFHELFHDYQFREVPDQWYAADAMANQAGYPVNEETLPYLIMYFRAMSDAYNPAYDHDEKIEALTNYLSINSKLLEIDDTDENLIRNHGFLQEKTEGAARFVEVFSTLETLDNDLIEDPTHGYGDYIDAIDNIQQDGRYVYRHRIFYHTGAAALYLLRELGHTNIEQDLLIPENMPYDLANSFLPLNQQEKDNALIALKVTYNWDSILARADELLN